MKRIESLPKHARAKAEPRFPADVFEDGAVHEIDINEFGGFKSIVGLRARLRREATAFGVRVVTRTIDDKTIAVQAVKPGGKKGRPRS